MFTQGYNWYVWGAAAGAELGDATMERQEEILQAIAELTSATWSETEKLAAIAKLQVICDQTDQPKLIG